MLLNGLVLLWGTEYCSLEAWKYARSFSETRGGEKYGDGGAMKELIPSVNRSSLCLLYLDFAAFELLSTALSNCLLVYIERSIVLTRL